MAKAKTTETTETTETKTEKPKAKYEFVRAVGIALGGTTHTLPASKRARALAIVAAFAERHKRKPNASELAVILGNVSTIMARSANFAYDIKNRESEMRAYARWSLKSGTCRDADLQAAMPWARAIVNDGKPVTETKK